MDNNEKIEAEIENEADQSDTSAEIEGDADQNDTPAEIEHKTEQSDISSTKPEWWQNQNMLIPVGIALMSLVIGIILIVMFSSSNDGHDYEVSDIDVDDVAKVAVTVYVRASS